MALCQTNLCEWPQGQESVAAWQLSAPPAALSADYAQLLLREEGADVHIRVRGGEELPAHSQVR